jgi:drug/metabolite transporter (DMT)-like permease
MKGLSGTLLVIISAASFGTLAVLAPLAYREGTNPVTFLFLRFIIAGTVMVFVMRFRRMVLPKGKILLGLVLMGGVWYVVQSLAYFTALGRASPGLVVLLLYLYPALVTLLSGVVLKERVTRAKAMALGLAMVGTFLTIGPSGEGEMVGVVLALTAAVLYAGYIVVGDQLMRQVEAFPATAVIMVATGVVYGGIVAVRGFESPTTAVGWGAILASAGFSIVALGTFFAGLEQVGSANAAILSTVEPLVTVGLAALLLDERLEWVRVVGGLCILGAVVGLGRRGVREENETWR